MMNRRTFSLVLIALTLVAADPALDALNAAKESRKLKKWGGVSAMESQKEVRALLETCEDDFRGCDETLSACESDNTACTSSAVICADNLAICRDDISTYDANLAHQQAACDANLADQEAACDANLADQEAACDANLADQQATHEKLMRFLPAPMKNPKPGSDMEKVSPEVGVDCVAIRRRIEKCELQLENQQSQQSQSTQAPTPDSQGPPAPPPAAQDSSASPPDSQGPPAPPPAAQDSSASPPPLPAPDYTYHFCCFLLVVLVCFGFRIGPWVVRNAERRLRDASERHLRDACARNDVYWHKYSPAKQEFQFQLQLTKLRRLERNWSFSSVLSRFLGFE